MPTIRLHADHCIWTGGIVRVGPCEWDADASALPEWDALHGALARGFAEVVDGPTQDEGKPTRRRRRKAATPAPAPEPEPDPTPEPELAPVIDDALADTIDSIDTQTDEG
jgi:hypothetical protein